MGICNSHVIMRGPIYDSRIGKSLKNAWTTLAAASIVSISRPSSKYSLM